MKEMLKERAAKATARNLAASALIAASISVLPNPAAAQDKEKTLSNLYIYISKNLPQTLYLIKDGNIIFQSLVNTGIPQAKTPVGKFTIFASYLLKEMRGRNPRTGKLYDDKDVPYAMYFNGGDAIHGFLRNDYGRPQSFGCVELRVERARALFQMLNGGKGTSVKVEYERPPEAAVFLAAQKRGEGQQLPPQ